MVIDPEVRPRLRKGCRLSEVAGQEDILLVPEGVFKLVGPGRRILELCDGHHSFGQILSALHALHPSAPVDQIERETAAYLDALCGRGAVEL